MIGMKLKIASLIMVVILFCPHLLLYLQIALGQLKKQLTTFTMTVILPMPPLELLLSVLTRFCINMSLRKTLLQQEIIFFQNASGEYFARKDGDVANVSKSDVISFFEDVKAEMQALNEDEKITQSNLNDKTLAALQKAVSLQSNSGVKSALITLFCKRSEC